MVLNKGSSRGNKGLIGRAKAQVDRSIILISHGKDDEAQRFVILFLRVGKMFKNYGPPDV